MKLYLRHTTAVCGPGEEASLCVRIRADAVGYSYINFKQSDACVFVSVQYPIAIICKKQPFRSFLESDHKPMPPRPYGLCLVGSGSGSGSPPRSWIITA